MGTAVASSAATSPLPGARRPRRNTRDAILATAAASFAEVGYHRTSLHEIAEAVGIQKASIFHHFASKALLYHAVLEVGRVQLEAAVRSALSVQGGWSARVRALLDAYIDLVSANPEQTNILLRQSLGDAPEGYFADADSDRLLGIVTGFLSEGQRAGAFAPIDGYSLVLGVIGTVTFFFTSVPVVAPRWGAEVSLEERVQKLRQHLVTVVVRALTPSPAISRVG